MKYQIHSFPNQESTLCDLSASAEGENMHSSIGPWNEANLLYLGQAGLDRWVSSEPRVVYDVGLGIAANALAFLEYSQIHLKCPVHLISFETDPSGLEFALQHAQKFPWLARSETCVRRLLAEGSVTLTLPSGFPFHWQLCRGDFREGLLMAKQIGRPMPWADVIFYDLYSPAKCPELWTKAYFDALFQASYPSGTSGTSRTTQRSTRLVTYSVSTSVRAALILAGFSVGRGKSTLEKRETTVASTLPVDLEDPLGEEWLLHWERSSKPLPLDCVNLPRQDLLNQLRRSCTF